MQTFKMKEHMETQGSTCGQGCGDPALPSSLLLGMRPTLLPYNTGGLDFPVRQIMKTSVPLSADKANPCLTQAEPTQQVNKWERTELSLDAPNAPELAAYT